MNMHDQMLLPQQPLDSNSSLSTFPRDRRVIAEVFGQLDTTPWSVFWLTFAWAVVEAIPGSQMLLSDFNATTPVGNSIPGAFFLAASVATGSIWVWWTILGSMPRNRQWQIFLLSCLALIACRFLMPVQLVSLMAVFAWAIVGVTAVALAVRHLLGLSLEPVQVELKSDLTIWLLLRYTLAAAVLAWFTRSIADDEDALLSTFEILAISLPLGATLGLASFAMLWVLARKYRWIYIGTLYVVVLPISATTALYFTRMIPTQALLIGAIFAASVSFVLHLLLFSLPLIARGFRFHQNIR